jgi:3-hydroxyisobutyrate dehydrogenase-like beta-hydroxyacid dehydrogenase
MGTALARAFLSKDHNVTIWNRTPGKASTLETAGARVAPTAGESVTLSSLIVTCVTNPDALHETLSTLDASAGNGRILVDFTTGSPSHIRQAARTVTRLGFPACIHGSVMAFPAQVGRRDAVMFYSGDHDAYTSVEVILSYRWSQAFEITIRSLQWFLLCSSSYCIEPALLSM